ncbi:MAG: PKD domain-containing protein [Verrucomicrobiae bacterium]|nr:PKD domain-containing protein [Verrucomicrobiae bacterium]
MLVTAAGLGGTAQAQQSVTNVIPIQPYYVTWDYLHTGGFGRACGHYLYARFPAFLVYTNTADYVVNALDANGRRINPDWTNPRPNPGENFVFGVGGNWGTGPAEGSPCPLLPTTPPPSGWTADLIVPPPNVSFSSIVSPNAPGRVKFTSTSTDSKRKALEYLWTFGDGSGGDTFAAPSHDYEKPGVYDVILRATNPAGAFATRTNKVTVQPPQLSVSMAFVDRLDSRPTLGETVTVRATVRASRNGLGDLSGVRFAGSPALVIPEVFEVVAEPPDLAVGDLQPGESRSFDWTLKVVNAGQFVLHTTQVTGTDAAGRPVIGAEGALQGSVSGLKVEVTFLDPPLQLNKKPTANGELSSNPGYEPGHMPVRVKVSVPKGGKPVVDVTLQGWDMGDGGLDIDKVRATGVPGQPFALAVPQPVPFPLTVRQKPPQATIQRVLTEDDPPLEFDFLVEAERPGIFAFAALFTARQIGVNTGLQERGLGLHPVLGDLVLSVQLEVLNETLLIKEGETVNIAGSVKNLTDNETVLLDPIHILNHGQGSVSGPVDLHSPMPPDGFLGIFNPILTPDTPDNEARFHARVKTARIPGLDQRFIRDPSYKAVIVDFAVGGQVIGEDGAVRELQPENILVEWGRGAVSFGGVTALYVPVAPNPLPTRELDPVEFTFTVGGAGLNNTIQGIGEAFALENIGQIISSYGTAAWSLSSFAVRAGNQLEEEAMLALVAAFKYQTTVTEWFLAVHQGVSATTKSEELDAIAAEVQAYYGRKFESVEQVKPLVNSAWNAFINKLADLKRQSWDYDYEFNARTADHLTGWLRPAAKFVTEEAVQDVALGLIWKRFVKSPKIADEIAAAAEKEAIQAANAAESATAAIARRGEAGHPRLVPATADLRNLKGGTLINSAQAIRGWAVDKVTDENLIKLSNFKDGGLPILVAIRSRADETLEWMSTRLGMTPKPVPIKQKNVNLIDETYLGYRRGVGYGDEKNLFRGAGDRGSVIIAEPLPPHVVDARLQGATPEVREAVIERYRERWEEWYGNGSLPADPMQMPFDDTIRPGSKYLELKFKANKVVTGDGTTRLTTLKGTLDVPAKGSVTDPRINLDVFQPGDEKTFVPRQLELRQVAEPPDNQYFVGRDREYYEVWLEDELGDLPGTVGGKPGVLRRVSGDVDVVMAADISGYRFGINPAKAIKDYGNRIARILQHVMKAQHPWSSSLAPEKLRNKFMRDHLWHPTDPAKRGEPLLVYFNGERRVAWIDPTKAPDLNNVIDPENPLASLVFLDGGPTSVADVIRRQVADRQDLPRPTDVAPKLTPTGFSAVRQALIDTDQLHNTSFLATCAIVTGARNGSIYRLGQNNELQERSPDGSWMATSPGAECGPDGIVLVPETILLTDVAAGALRLPILEDFLGADWRNLFRIGDDVIIAPDTPQWELNTIENRGSLMLSRPTKYSHPAGTRVVVLPPSPTAAVATTGPPLLWLKADAGIELEGPNVVTWTDQAAGVRFINPEGGFDGFPVRVDTDLGLPAIQFRGDEWITGGIARQLTTATIFTLCRFNVASSSGNDHLYSLGRPGAAGSMMTLARRNGDDAYHFDGRDAYAPNTSLPADTWQILTQVYGEDDPNSHRLFKDGTLILNTRAANPYRVDASQMFLGNYLEGSHFLIGDIVEWLVFDRALPPAERAGMELYLKKRGGLFQPPPAPAPLVLAIRPASTGVDRWILSWQSEAGRQYHLDRSTTLQPGSWVTEGTITPPRPGTAEIELSPPPMDSSGAFYRLRIN